MARGLIGKALRGAAQGYAQAAPFIMEEKRQNNRLDLEKRQQEAIRLRDERLAEIRQREQAAQNEFTAEQNQARLEQSANQHADEMGIRQENLEMAREQFQRTMDNLDLQIRQGQLTLEDQKAVRELTETYSSANEEERGRILEALMIRRGDSPIEYFTTQGIDAETGERIQDLVRVNTARGTEQMVTGPGNNAGPSGIPPGAIQELMQDPSPETRAEFDEYFGAGASDQILGPLQSGPSNVSSPAASQGQSGGLISGRAGSMPPLPLLAPGSRYVSGPPEMIESSGRNPSRLRYPSTAPVKGVDRFSQR